MGRALSTQLHPYLVEFIRPQTWSDLAWIAVAQGPGSFTGTRIGVVAARTLAQQLQIPVFAFSILAASAWADVTLNPWDDPATETIVAVERPGHRDTVHGGIYRVVPERLDLGVIMDDRVYPIAEWETVLSAQPMIHRRVQTADASMPAEDLGRALLALAHQRWLQGDRPAWHTALPHYG